MTRLSVSLLDSCQIILDGKPARAFTYAKAQGLLAYLAVEAERAHSRNSLVALFWPELPKAAGLTNLRQALADLRRVLGEVKNSPPFLHITRTTVQFNAQSSFELDVKTFMHIIAQCGSHNHRHISRCRGCSNRLEEAITLYQGDFLAGFAVGGAEPFDDWVSTCREEYHRHAIRILDYLIAYHLRSRNQEQAQHYLRFQIELEPWHEEAHNRLIRLYAASGKRGEALLQYETCRSVLQSEFGADPLPHTQTLYAQILQGIDVEEVAAGSHGYWQELPLVGKSFEGRKEELLYIDKLLEDPAHRLITIFGPGGIGKTRIAQAAAMHHATAFESGVVFVPLAGVNDARLLAQAILTALNLPTVGLQDPQAQVLESLRGLELLLLLDNYEQLLPDVGLLTLLLRTMPRLTVMVTSRERLALQAEHVLELGGLEYPDDPELNAAAILEEYSALLLFLARVRQIQHDFAPTALDIDAILRIAQITEGMPLALEFAASAVRAQSCKTIALTLERGQQLLSTQPRDFPERHSSMKAVFDHSLHLLADEEQRVFCALAVFRGGFDAKAGQDVAQATPEILASLLDKSMLSTTRPERYEMHELIRQYGEAQLQSRGELVQTQGRFADYFINFAVEAEQGLQGTEQAEWVVRVEQEIDNLRAALTGLAQTRPQAALQMTLNLFWLWQSRTYVQEGIDRLNDLSALDESISPLLRAHGYRVASLLALCLNQIEQARISAKYGLAIFETLDMRDSNVTAEYAHLLATTAAESLCSNDYEKTVTVSLRAMEIAQRVGDESVVSTAAYFAGDGYYMLGQFDEAEARYAQSLNIVQEKDNLRRIGRRLDRLSLIACVHNDLEKAHRLCCQAWLLAYECHDLVGISEVPIIMAKIAILAKNYQRATRLIAAVEPIIHGHPLWPVEQSVRDDVLATIHQHLDEPTFNSCWAEGRTLALEEVSEYLLADTQ